MFKATLIYAVVMGGMAYAAVAPMLAQLAVAAGR